MGGFKGSPPPRQWVSHCVIHLQVSHLKIVGFLCFLGTAIRGFQSALSII